MKLAPICEMQIVTGDRLKAIALLRPQDKARMFTTSLSFRSGDARYAWVNGTVGAVGGILNTTTDQMIVRANACQNELATIPV